VEFLTNRRLAKGLLLRERRDLPSQSSTRLLPRDQRP
jgi:hypothetical protein